MIAVRTIQAIVGIAGLAALALGLTFWITQLDVVSFHILFGLIVALTLLVMSILALSTRSMRVWGMAGIVYALIVPVLGVKQSTLLIGDLHWLIQTTHMLVGLGAMALTGRMAARYMALRRTPARPSAEPEPQAVR